MGVLTEHYAGAFPLWLAPKQVAVVPIADRHIEACAEIANKLKEQGIRTLLDDRTESMNYKIRDCLQNKKIPYVLVLGDREIETGNIAVRARGRGQIGEMNLDTLQEKLQKEISSKGKYIVE